MYMKMFLFFLYSSLSSFSVSTLPITSTPLENNPDILAFDTSSTLDAKPKIPKSIFITPNLNSSRGSCAPGHKLGPDGKCYKTLTLNPFELLQTQIHSLVQKPDHIDYDEYDYDTFDKNEQYKVELNIRFADDKKLSKVNSGHADYIEEKNESNIMPFLAPQTSSYNQISSSTEPIDSKNVDGTTLDITTVYKSDIVHMENNNKYTDTTESHITTGTIINPLPDNLEQLTLPKIDQSNLPGGKISSSNKIYNIFPEVKFTGTSKNSTEAILSNNESSSTSINLFNTPVVSTTSLSRLNDKIQTNFDNQIDSSISKAEINLTSVLEAESLFQGERIEDNVNDISTTWIINLDSEKVTTPISIKTDDQKHSTVEIYRSTSPASIDLIKNVTPSEEMKATTIEVKREPNHSNIDFEGVSSSAMASFESKTSKSDILNIANDSEINNLLRESLIKQEINEANRGTLDAKNRFVYHHLVLSEENTTNQVNTSPPPSTKFNTDEPKRIHTNVEHIHRNQENPSKVRFSSHDPSPLTNHNLQTTIIKFPGPAHNRITNMRENITLKSPQLNNLIPDMITATKPPTGRHEKPPFWWLPRDWQIDQIDRKPILMRFWSRMPLVGDSTGLNIRNSDHGKLLGSRRRENSKLPTDNLYKEIPAVDVYKVLSSKNYKYNNR